MKESKYFVRLSETPFPQRLLFCIFLDVDGGELFAVRRCISSVQEAGGATYEHGDLQADKSGDRKDGKPVPTAVSTPLQRCYHAVGLRRVPLLHRRAQIRQIKGTDGLSLRLTPKSSPFGSTVTDLMDGTGS
jgi:hypothetical protein